MTTPVLAEGVRFIDAFCLDLCGTVRGKRLPRDKFDDLQAGKVRFPSAALSLGLIEDTASSENLSNFRSEDATAMLRFGPLHLQGDGQLADCLVGLMKTPAEAHPLEPRTILERVLGQLASEGIFLRLGVELEFYVFPTGDGDPPPALSPAAPFTGNNLYALDVMCELRAFHDDIARMCDALGLAVDALNQERGHMQLEVAFAHSADILGMCDRITLFKKNLKTIARRHGLTATFMAKPFGHLPGSGLHVHMSAYDAAGRPLFQPGQLGEASPVVRAVDGLLRTAQDYFLVFAPNMNSYRRLKSAVTAPAQVNAATYDRSAAIRIIEGAQSCRLEHRLAGADANLYLVMAALGAGVLEGEPAALEAVKRKSPVPNSMWDTVQAFRASASVKRRFGAPVARVLSDIKAKECQLFNRVIPREEVDCYRDRA